MRSTATELIRRVPLISYVVLAYLFSIALDVLLNVSLAFGLIALFGPAAAAFIVARTWRGRDGVADLWAVTTRWRVPALWYVAVPCSASQMRRWILGPRRSGQPRASCSSGPSLA